MFPRIAEPERKTLTCIWQLQASVYCRGRGATFRKADPVTEEEKAEFEAMWKVMIGGNYSPEKKKG